ncbi:MAG TPA: MEDS domain-containing protein, partial [Terriglobales bacterium]|nr:MEDS domain-containing protein [Terriglobales bacterium]
MAPLLSIYCGDTIGGGLLHENPFFVPRKKYDFGTDWAEERFPVATTERDELIRNHPVIGEVEFGIGEGKVSQTAHVAYFWETEKEFADGVRFLEAGLHGLDHCVIFGHEEANQAVCNILQNHGFDVKDLLAQQRITILGGNPSGEIILETIGDTFQQALARGTPLIRLLGNIGWGKSGWPGDYDLLAFEAKVTAATKEFPCVVMCMYDVAALPGLVIRRGAYGTHPLIEREGSLQENPDYVPADFFLKHLELIADALSERRQAQAESRRANESLHRTEIYLAEAQRLSHTGSWAFNVATREIVHWSQEHFRMFSFDPEDGMPSFETLMQRIHPDDRAN